MNRPVIPPTYRNERLRDFQLWYRDNEPKLSEYFSALCAIEPQGCDFWEFAVIQHEREEYHALQAEFNDSTLSQLMPCAAV